MKSRSQHRIDTSGPRLLVCTLLFLLVLTTLYSDDQIPLPVPQQQVYTITLVTSYRLTDPLLMEKLLGFYEVLSQHDFVFEILNIDSDAAVLQQRRDTDFVVTTDDLALQYLLDEAPGFLDATPCIALDVMDDDLYQRVALRSTCIGIAQNESAEANIDFILTVFPEVKNVVVITEDSEYGIRQGGEIEEARAAFPEISMTHIALGEVSWDSMLQTIGGLSSHDVLYIMSAAISDRDTLRGLASISEIRSTNLSLPIFSSDNHYMGSGIIGGVVNDKRDQAAAAAEIVQDFFLSGGRPASMDGQSIQTIDSDRVFLDYSQVRDFGIKLNRLPPDIIFLNRPGDYLDKYSNYIWVGTLFILIQTVLLFTLIILVLRLKRAERDVQTREKDLRRTLNSIGDGVITTDAAGRVVRMNPVAEELTGMHLDDVKGQSVETCMWLTHGSTHASKDNPVWQVIETRQEISIESDLLLLTKGGRESSVSMNVSPILQGNQLVGTVIIIRDRTDLVRRDRDLNLIRFAFDQSIDEIYFLAQDGTLLYGNKMVLDDLEVAIEDIQTMSIYDMSLTASQSNWQEHWEKLKSERVYKFENAHFSKEQQTYHPVEVQQYFLEYEGMEMICAIARDISERKETERILREQSEQLLQSRKIEAVGQLAGGIAHDFNNLLHIIIGYVDMIRSEFPELHEQVLKHLSIIDEATRKGSDLVKKLMLFSRKGLHETGAINLKHQIAGMVEMLTDIIGGNIELRIHTKDDTPLMVNMDPEKIDQVIINLCINSRDAIGARAGQVIISVDQVVIDETNPLGLDKGLYGIVCVADNGPGIPQSVRSRIFEPFFTTKTFGKGAGMGLASSYGIARQHNGTMTFTTVSVEDSPQGPYGTTFCLYLPMIPEDNPIYRLQQRSAGETGEHVSEGDDQDRSDTMTILLAEDERSVRTLTSVVLEKEGYVVHAAEDGVQAIELYEEHKEEIDLILLDAVMPGKNGHEVFQVIRDQDTGIPILFCSGYAQEELYHDILSDPHVTFLAKPYYKKELLEMINKVMGR